MDALLDKMSWIVVALKSLYFNQSNLLMARLSVGFSTQEEAMDVARSAPQGAHYHADVIYLLP